MAIRKINFSNDEYYHIYNRGNSKQNIFHDTEDYLVFKKYLYVFNQEQRIQLRDIAKNPFTRNRNSNPLVAIGAYVLMPNHFHILIKEINQGGTSRFMQKLATGYAMYYNQKYKRTGSLFEGKFKATHVNNDRYLKYIFSYIHLNPVKLIQKDWKEKGVHNQSEVISFLNKYYSSSYVDYKGEQRSEKSILSTEVFPKYFPNKNSFIKEIFNWIDFTTEARPQG